MEIECARTLMGNGDGVSALKPHQRPGRRSDVKFYHEASSYGLFSCSLLFFSRHLCQANSRLRRFRFRSEMAGNREIKAMKSNISNKLVLLPLYSVTDFYV